MTKFDKSAKEEIISAKQAALNAKNFFTDVIGAEGNRITLEEVSLSEDKKYWFITLGIYSKTDNPVLLAQGLKELLNYKTFKIDAKSGDVISMDIKFITYPKPQNG
ncbi:MAG: hypothetical protein Q7R31_01650 [Candidatus Levybacteria bacterium]|nr:hypothetical protein [Candidatus Levybacteria bacterium]